MDAGELRARAQAAAADFQRLLGGAVAQARQILRKLLDGPIRVEVMPNAEGIRLRSRINLGALCPSLLASQSIPSWNQLLVWLRQMQSLRESVGNAA